MPELSIVTGHLDRPNEFHGLYQSILEHTQDVDWELVVSDASIGQPLDPRNYLRTRIFRESPRLGHAVGYNLAFRAAQGEWVIWLNDDAIVTPYWARNAIDFMKRNPHVGLGALYYCVDWPPFFCNEYQGLPYANFGILRKDFGDSLGWFDEEVRMYGADNSLTFKTFLAGKIVAGIAGSRVIHHPCLDGHRYNNEAGQIEDASILMTKYRHLLPRMWAVNEQFKGCPLV